MTHRDKQPFTLTFAPTGNLESPINLHVFGLWEEAGVLEGNPGRHGENMQTPYRKVLSPAGYQTQNLLAVRQQC